MKKRTILFAFIILFSLSYFACTSKIRPQLTKGELHDHIQFLASDSLKGRYPGTPEDKIAAEYIASDLKNNGLELLFDKGLQAFEITTSLESGNNNSLTINNQEFILNEDFTPIVFSTNKVLEAEVVFVGYGFKIEQGVNIWNDYASVDVKGKWVLILRDEPENTTESFPFSMFSGLRSKAITAKDQGAAGVIFVSGKQVDEDDELIKLSRPEGEVGIPVIQVKRNIANIILSSTDYTIEDIEGELISDNNSLLTGTTINCQTDILTSHEQTYNIAAQLLINPDYEYIVIGGHYDHLGYGGKGTGTRAPGTKAIHYGADDNASGIASMLEIAEKLVTKKDSLKNNFLFVAFGAEEMGLIGSKYFVNNLPFPDSLIKTMINIDMLGRMKDDKSLQIGGVGTSIEGETLLDSINSNYNFKLGFSQEGYGPSDHSSFYSKDIPVFFFSTGAHIDYHTPGDSTGSINFDGLLEASNYIYDFTFMLSSENIYLTYKEAGPKAPSANVRNARLKVSLGIMPDFSGVEKRGLRADIIIPGKPAEKAGLKTGDIIVAIDGNPVGDVYEYMERLAKLKSSQIITVEVLREEKKEVFIVQL